MEQEVQERLYFLQAADIEGDLFGGPVPAKHLHLVERIVDEQQELGLYAGELFRDAAKYASTGKRPIDNAVAWALIKHGFPLLAGFSDGKAVGELEKMQQPVEAPAGVKRKGAHRRSRAMLRPKWVRVSEAARALGVQRSTLLKWHEQGRLVVPAEGGPASLSVRRNSFGQVNLTLLQHIAEQKRALPGPGRRLGGQGSRELVEAATRAHTDPKKAADYARTCKALSLLGRVQSGPLLQAARRQLNRLILRRRA